MRLGFFLLVLFPITELMILIKVGGLIGVLPTIALIFFTASAGLFLLRQEGFSTLMRAQQKMSSGEVPAMEMMEGLVIAFCGALLLAPGFISDTVALCGLIPPIRRKLIRRMTSSSRFQVYTSGGVGMGGQFRGNDFRQPFAQPSSDDAIDGEFRREE
ncbi:FxsA family protein [Parendozoicomonas sp. Alg238-R29]|uniref:FxsA family protein n=1 Tax=Parendozoicomonas sp. Alg238-R29 TaxID=2993446 RepID=UPI00248E0008|nr:FxsA family protein [Parendozoicomonas sp. Alg238-R29]